MGFWNVGADLVALISVIFPIFNPLPAHIIFGGDIMLDRGIRTAIAARGGDFVFSCIDNELKKADAVVANLEGPLTDNPSVSVNSIPGDGANYTFTFPISSPALLRKHNIGIVNLGNNHIYNFGAQGVGSTTASLKSAGITYFGDPPKYSVAHQRVRGLPLAFINYNEFGGSASTTLVQIDLSRTLGEIPIVYTHWGIEYASTSVARIRALAHKFVDEGAEIVIGSHPHVVEDHELYRGKHIYYSLGNFFFDQYFSDAVRRGLLLDVALDRTGVKSVREIPIELLRDGRTCSVE